jgi:hypothetical protein
MAVQATWGSNRLYISSVAAAARPYLDFFHFYMNSTTDAAFATGPGSYNASDNTYTNGRWARIEAANSSRRVGARELDSASNTALTVNVYTPQTWQTAAVSFIEATRRESWINGNITDKGVDTNSRTPGTLNYTLLGSLPDNTLASNSVSYAEISRWDVTGFTEANRNALVTRLNTLVESEYPNPRTVNEDAAEPWTGKLVRYWPLTTNSDLADAAGSADTWLVTGTVNTSGVGHPSVATYSAASALYPDMEPLYYGATLLASKTNIEYAVWLGTAFNTQPDASGVNGTTDSLGVFQFPGVGFAGVAADPAVVALYWEEGNPAVDRSLIVKTTLVEDV